MICKDSTHQEQQQQQQQETQQLQNIYNTLQHRRKSQLITFSASANDIKHNLSSHDMTLFNGLNGNAARNSIISNASSNGQNARLSFAEEDVMIINQNGSLNDAGVGIVTELEDEVFRRNSLEADQGVEGDADMDEELFDDELLYCGTHISASHNANDDSGGGSGSYEDSHALHSSIGGSNRNSLEKDDDDVDVISTDVSCYDQLVGSAGVNAEQTDTAAPNYTKLKITLNGSIVNKDLVSGGVGGGGGFSTNITKGGDCAGSVYANPFMGL